MFSFEAGKWRELRGAFGMWTWSRSSGHRPGHGRPAFGDAPGMRRGEGSMKDGHLRLGPVVGRVVGVNREQEKTRLSPRHPKHEARNGIYVRWLYSTAVQRAARLATADELLSRLGECPRYHHPDDT